MKKIFDAALRLVLCLSVLLPAASCGFDDEDDVEATYPMELLGSWTGVSAEVSVTVDGAEPVTTTADLSDMRIAINPNGTFVTYGKAEGGDTWREEDRGFWSYKESKLYVTSKGGRDMVYSVDVLTAYSLVLTSTHADTGEDGVKTVTRNTATYNRSL